MTYQNEVRPAKHGRLATALDKAEHIYLRLLRAIILIIATGMIVYAAWLALSSLYKVSRSPDSVKEAVARVQADEITDAQIAAPRPANAGEPSINPAHQHYYADFVNRYYQLFKTKFEPYRQKEDKQLSRGEFDDSFVHSMDRLASIKAGDLNFEKDRADLESLYKVVAEAVRKPVIQQRLQRYKTANKVRVANKIQRSRTEYREGWDSYSTACEDWYDSPYGCAVRRAVQVPYTETVYSMEFPKGTQSHTQIFGAFQERFFTLLNERRERNAADAERERTEILIGKEQAGVTMYTALKVVGGFLLLMFVFLLIAIERHQRKLASKAIA